MNPKLPGIWQRTRTSPTNLQTKRTWRSAAFPQPHALNPCKPSGSHKCRVEHQEVASWGSCSPGRSDSRSRDWRNLFPPTLKRERSLSKAFGNQSARTYAPTCYILQYPESPTPIPLQRKAKADRTYLFCLKFRSQRMSWALCEIQMEGSSRVRPGKVDAPLGTLSRH